MSPLPSADECLRSPIGSSFRFMLDARRIKKQGSTAIAERQRTRLGAMVTYARVHSPYYRELYERLPEHVDHPSELPVTSKKQLMARFNDVATDPSVTLEKVKAFVDDPQRIGEKFLGKYTALTTSGTTGTRGIFLLDSRSMAVTNALALRMLGAWLGVGDIIKIARERGRMSMVMATGSHFASAVAAARLSKRQGRRLQILSAHMPLPEMVEKLNAFRPAIVAPYASIALMLAGEQEAGRLLIHPALFALAAEGLSAREYDKIARIFKTKVGNSYAATECPFLSYACEHGWLHVNGDWVIVEPVDAAYRPTRPGEQSHTVLISNLANQVQPILRYDLGDSVVQRPDPCPCGNPFLAIRVQGRAADVLTFSTTRGERIAIPPLALELDIPEVELFQVVQTSHSGMRIRFKPATGANKDHVWQQVERQMARLLSEYRLDNVTVERATELPAQSPGGKFRSVIPVA